MRPTETNDEFLTDNPAEPAGSLVARNHRIIKGDEINQELSGRQSSSERPITDFSFAKNALKTLCREHEVTRDRKAKLELATLVLALIKEGVRDEEQLTVRARTKWLESGRCSKSQ